MLKNKKIIAVTGYTSCGKTTLCKKLVECASLRGITCKVIDVDAIRRQFMDTDSHVKAWIAGRFSGDFISSEGTVDRMRLAREFSKDPMSQDEFDVFINPPLRSLVVEFVSKESDINLIDDALICERGWHDLIQCAVIVQCSGAELRKRHERGDLTAMQCAFRLSRQWSPEQKARFLSSHNIPFKTMDCTRPPAEDAISDVIRFF